MFLTDIVVDQGRPRATDLPRGGRWPALAVAVGLLLGLMVITERLEGRRWWCACGRPVPWSGDIHGAHNSQHLVDPYSFTHLLHGALIYALLRPLAGRLSPRARLVLAAALEVAWELVENSPLVIGRYRHDTVAQGYSGDSVINSLGDVVSCLAGYALARRLPAWGSVVLFVVIEAGMLAVYRDSLTLNVLMLFAPLPSVRAWQAGGVVR